MSEMDLHATDDSAETSESGNPGELDIEAPEADAMEQHMAVREESLATARSIPLDVDEADAADQNRVVELDEDDYR
jgi:hypothetical protein